MRKILNDLAFSWKVVFEEKVFAIIALVTLGLCIAGNVLVFTITDSFVLRPLPYPKSDRLVDIYNNLPGYGFQRAVSSVIHYDERKEKISALEDVALFAFTSINVEVENSAYNMSVASVTPEFFRMLRVKPLMGRVLDESDFEGVQQNNHVVLCYPAWAKLFNRDPDVLGKAITLKGQQYTVVGIMPEGFYYNERYTQIFTPFSFSEGQYNEKQRHGRHGVMLGRIANGYTIEDVRTQIDELNQSNYKNIVTVENREAYDVGGFATTVKPLVTRRSEPYQNKLYLLQGGVFIMLLVGCMNVSNLLLVRSNARMSEFAIRSAVGCRKTGIFRLILCESLILSLIGGFIGAVVGALGVMSIDKAFAIRSTFGIDLTLELPSIIFAIGVSIFAGFICGGFSLFRLFGNNTSDMLKEDSRTGSASSFVSKMTSGLVVAQIGLTFALAYVTLLLYISFSNVTNANIGFKTDRLYNAMMSFRGSAYSDADKVRVVIEQLRDKISDISGVESVGISRGAPFAKIPGFYLYNMTIQSKPEVNAISRTMPITPGTLETWGVKLREGRMLKETDNEDSALVTVIDTFSANKYFPEGAIGQRVRFNDPSFRGDANAYMEIVGVVDHVKIRELDLRNLKEKGVAYFTYKQLPIRNIAINIKSDLDQTSLRLAVEDIVKKTAPGLPLYDFASQQSRIDYAIIKSRVFVVTFLACSVTSLALSILGVFGLVSYVSSMMTREVGIRKTLGAHKHQIVSMMMVLGLKRLVIGLLVGFGIVGLCTDLIRGYLFDLSVFNADLFTWVSILIVVGGGIATYLPARKISKLSPSIALRDD
ncbi:ABC transporter permease [Puniceicoccaceae bacterium K14]|nr:ABC transporter permease [Puniceicoccaceae bacterium K14]